MIHIHHFTTQMSEQKRKRESDSEDDVSHLPPRRISERLAEQRMNRIQSNGYLLCDYCLNKVFSSDSWSKLWKSMDMTLWVKIRKKQLKQSAKDGCWFCRLLFAELQYLDKADRRGEMVLEIEFPEPPSNYDPDGSVQMHVICGKANHVIQFDFLLFRGSHQSPSLILPDLTEKQEEIEDGGLLGSTFPPRLRSEIDPDDGLIISTAASSTYKNFDTKQTKSWITTCLNQHEGCRGTISSSAPTRLIAINAEDLSIRIISHVNDAPGYLALSYCWGSSHNFTLTKDWLENFPSRDTLFEQLPRCYQDAVSVTVGLGYSYLWIDGLCIVQNDEDDKSREIARMHSYYSSAVVVIAATCCNNVQEGFLVRQNSLPDSKRLDLLPKSDREAASGKFPMMVDDVNFSDMFAREVDAYAPEREPLYQRAWTLQEVQLASRVLQFPSTGGWFLECDHSIYSGGDIFFPYYYDTVVPRRGSQLTSTQQWLRIAENYSNRLLTLVQEKLVAISALAEDFSVRDNCSLGAYYAGHWERDLVQSLIWRTSSKAGVLKVQHSSEKYSAPSWSMFNHDNLSTEHCFSPSCCRIVHISTVLKSDFHRFGAVQGGMLILEAFCLDFVIECVTDAKPGRRYPMKSCIKEGEETRLLEFGWIIPDSSIASDSTDCQGLMFCALSCDVSDLEGLGRLWQGHAEGFKMTGIAVKRIGNTKLCYRVGYGICDFIEFETALTKSSDVLTQQRVIIL